MSDNLANAAADLYEALNAIVSAENEAIGVLEKEYGFNRENRPAWLVRLRAAEAALAKARGETPPPSPPDLAETTHRNEREQ